MTQLTSRITPNLHDIHMVLNYGPLGFVQAITERIDQHHIQVYTGSITLNHNAKVEIVMSIPGVKYSEYHRIAAQVSHCGGDGHSTLSFYGCGEKTLLALLPYLSRH
jgi:hypothetical protein